MLRKTADSSSAKEQQIQNDRGRLLYALRADIWLHSFVHLPLTLNPTSTLVARYGAVGRDKMSIFNAGVTYLKNSDE